MFAVLESVVSMFEPLILNELPMRSAVVTAPQPGARWNFGAYESDQRELLEQNSTQLLEELDVSFCRGRFDR